MTEATQAPTERKARAKLFGRNYNHEAHSLKVEVLGAPDKTIEQSLADIPEATMKSLALQALADFAVGAGNEALREGADHDTAYKAVQDAFKQAAEGKIEFTSGVGLGMSSAPATRLVARALVENGNKFVKWNGKQYDFEGDVEKATEAMRSLYFDTNEIELPNKTKMSGRQFFRQIADIPAIREKLDSWKKAKPVNSVVQEGLG